MKVLITGGAGFIGSHLAEKCLSAGHEVFIIDNLSTGSIDNITHLLSTYKGKIRFLHASADDEKALLPILGKSECIYHLASVVGVKRVLAEPLTTVQEGLNSAALILCKAAQEQIPTLIASTSEVYGRALDYLDSTQSQSLSEDFPLVLRSPQRHRWIYAITKLASEALAIAYHKQRGAPFVVVRFFNTVGPRQSPAYGMVIPNLVRAALQGQPLPVYGSGQQKRSFLHVKDAVEAIYRLLVSPPPPPPWGEIFNLGNPHEISIYDLAEEIRRLTDTPAPIQLIPYEKSYGEGFEDMQRRTPDISKIQSYLGWSPTYTLNDILEEVIAYERKYLQV
ncbi:MAG: GDP-mannose 4,6-dehydratase [Bacteroidia bacterium]|nr:GDP-mannose 4,6-dehydratase [Bacteroidia bacterium]MDW8235172.1 GDP-mannose 4,6-dehydratase [Bacteroidia bacterium]